MIKEGMNVIIIFIYSLLLFVNSHNEGEREDDEPPPHKDFDPVVDFPDDDPDYKEEERVNMTSSEEKSHHSLHVITNGIIHKSIETQEKMKSMQKKVQDNMKKLG